MATYFSNKPLITLALMLFVVVTMTDHTSYTVGARDLSTVGYGEEAMKERYEKWMAEHGRTYKDDAHEAQRFQVFKANAEFIDRSNAAGKKYRLATNEFADMTADEFMAKYTGFKPLPSSGANKISGFKYENFTLSGDQEEVDWRKKDAVTDIKDQGQCGCCWAFSTTAAMEGMHKMETGRLVSLSEQQLVDCTANSKYGNNGCDGGLMDGSFQYIMDNGGIAAEDAYPYQATQGMCKSGTKPAATISKYQDVPSDDEEALASAVAHQPVSVALDAHNFQFYSTGVMTADMCGTDLNHAVAAIGYGKAEDGTQYWLLKNQWGKNWGDKGYMKLERGAGACGVAKKASFPVA